jgi:hypothetical protein
MPVSQVIPLFFPEANQQAIVATLIEEAAAAGLDEHVRGGMRVAIKDPQVSRRAALPAHMLSADLG